MSKTTKTSFDQYSMADGLSQDEFFELQVMRKMSVGNMSLEQVLTLIGYLERMIEAKEVQIADLNEELYQLSTKKPNTSHK